MKRLLQRPLCLFAVSYAIINFLLQMFVMSPREGAALWQSDKKVGKEQTTVKLQEGVQVTLTGQLYKKESKNNHLIFYLKDIQIIEVIHSKENSNQNSNSNFNLNEEKYLAGADKKGAFCYMAGDTGSDVPVGRWLYVKGQTLPFEAAENDGQFDAASYYAGIGFSVRLWNTDILQQGNSYDRFGNILVNIKRDVAARFQKYMQTENAGILCAMLLGDKTAMDAEVKNLYRKNGIAHVLAISGLHISLLGMMLYRFLRRIYFPPPLCSAIGIGFVLVYIKMVGFSVSSFRAVCMFILYMLADLLGRTYDLLTALAFSALLLLIDNPAAMFEAGFLLSYFAVLGLAVVLPVFRQVIHGGTGQEQTDGQMSAGHHGKGHKVFISRLMKTLWQKLILALLPGFSVQVLIFPITLWFYYEFPMYSFLLNLIVVPCMSVVLVSGMIGAVPGCGFVLYLTDFLLAFYEWLCRLTESRPGAVIVIGRPKLWQIVLYYVLIVLWLVVIAFCRGARPTDGRGSNRRERMQRIFLALFPLFCMLLFLLPVHRENRIDMLSVGQGDCVVMRDSSGRVVMVDGGSTDVDDVGKYRLLPFLKYHGISQIDAVFLSHAHEDHYSAIAELLESAGKDGVRIKTLCLTGYAAVASKPKATEISSSAQTYAQLIVLARHAGCEVVYLNPGDHITCGEMEFSCIYPPSDISVSDENDTSMVLLAKLSGFSVLFTGDSSSACDGEVIRRLHAMDIREIDCLKVAHHGARTSTSEALLDAFDFNLALISCGEGNSYGHPHDSLLTRLENAGCETLVTSDYGQVTVRIREGRAIVAAYARPLYGRKTSVL